MPSTPEYTQLFEQPMAQGATNATGAVLGDACNRYQCKPLGDADAGNKTNWLLKCEEKLADYFEQKFGLGVASGGLAIMLGLKAIHRVILENCDPKQVKVYSNSFTFNAVPSAIVNAGFAPAFVATTPLLTIDVDDLERKVQADLEAGTPRGSMILVLSYMRGRIPNMDRIQEICSKYDVKLLEDNAHGYGAAWKGKKTGSFGLVSAISTQANKLINTGEGGFVFTSCDRMHAFLMICAGCYEELFKKHEKLCPNPEAIEEMRFTVPNFSCRMSNVSAAVAYPQIDILAARIEAHNANYAKLQELVEAKVQTALQEMGDEGDVKQLIEFITQLEDVFPVYDSLQMRLSGLSDKGLQHMIKAMTGRGFKLQLFADKFNARYYRSWRYCIQDAEHDKFGETDRALEAVVDMRLLAHDTQEDVEEQATAISTCFIDAYKMGKKEETVKEGSIEVNVDEPKKEVNAAIADAKQIAEQQERMAMIASA